MSNKRFIPVIMACALLLTGCNKNTTSEVDSNTIIQNIASDNFDKYMETFGKQNLKAISENDEMSETEKVLYDFLSALTRKDYPVAMRLSNYHNQPFVTDQEFVDGLSLNEDIKYNYASVVSKDLNKGLKMSIVPVEDNSDMMFTTVLIDDTYEYLGALVKINGEWKVAVSGLRECTFEVPANEKLLINGTEIDESHKTSTQNGKDIYKVNLLNTEPNAEEKLVYAATGNCINSTLSGNLGNTNNTIELQVVCTDEEIELFIDWELDFYNNMYKDAVAGADISKYFNNDELMQTAKNEIKNQLSRHITDIVITDLHPTKLGQLESPIKKIDNNTIEASVTIIMSYKYMDKKGKIHTKDGVSDARACAVFKRADENSEWKMDKLVGPDPILTSSKFSTI